MKSSFYAVAVGKARGIYSTWAQCAEQVTGYPGSVFKSFRTLDEARGFLAAHPLPTTGSAVSVGGGSISVAAPYPPSREKGALGSSAFKRRLDRETSEDILAGEEVAARQAQRRRADDAHNTVHSPASSSTSTSISATTFSAAASHPLTTSTVASSSGTFEVVYVDGACSHNGTSQARAGYGGYYGSLSDPRNFSCPVPLTESQTNNRGELRAVIHAIVQSFVDAGAPADALEEAHRVDPSGWPLGDLVRPLPHLIIYTDSRYVIDGLTRHAKAWVQNGFALSTKKPVRNQDLWKQLIRLRDHYNTQYAKQQCWQRQLAHRWRDGDNDEADSAEPVRHTCHNTRNDKSEGIELIHVRGHSKVHGNDMADSLAMWVILFHDTPHFWLVGGESYRVGKKDCHVIIQGDRSISRTHLTIIVGLHPSTDTSGPGERAPQPISLLDSSTYGTAIVARGEEAETLDETDRSASDDGVDAGSAASRTLEAGFLGLCYAPAVTAAAEAERKRPRSGSTSGCRVPQPAVQLTKDVPCHVPVHRSSWHQFTVQLGHHGAALKLVWLDLSVLCEDVDIGVQTKLSHALRCCGVRQETVHGITQVASATETQGCTEGCWRDEDGAPGLPPNSVTVLGSSGLSLSQRTTVPGIPAVRPPLTAVAAAAADVGGTALSSDVSRCYNTVSFLVTSTVQPSTAVVAMLCRAVPIVTPAFFVAICNRSSPQMPLPDPSRFLPPLSQWWRDFLAHVVPPADESHPSGGDAEGRGASATASSLTPPSITVTAVADEGSTGVAAVSQLRYFAPHPRRRRLFRGVTFILLQWPLYEEVLSYLDGTGAQVLWEDGGISGLSAPLCRPTSSSQAALEALQSFFVRHQRHVVLFNEAEPLLPWPGCVDVVRHGLSLCSVEYGTLMEAIVTMRPLPLPAYPADAQMPQTLKEVGARVAAATATSSTSPSATAQEATEHVQGGDEQEGRRTDAQPLFPELVGGGGGGFSTALLPGSDAGLGRRDMRDARVHRRPRKEDIDGWVSFERSATVAPMATGNSTDGKPNPSATVRTVELHVGPYPLPPYPCFEDANAASADASAMGAAAVGFARDSKPFVKQTLPTAEPPVELEEHRARRQLAASMLIAHVPTVDAEGVVPEQVVMGSGGLASRVAEVTIGAFNAFDTVAHYAFSRRQGTAKRRGGRGGGASGAGTRAPAHRPLRCGTARRRSVDNIVTVEHAEDITVDSVEATVPRSGLGGDMSASAAESATFHIFDIDGIF